MLLYTLQVLDIRDNPDLVMPPKPPELARGAWSEFYGVDFSLEHQQELAGIAPVPSSADETPSKIARLLASMSAPVLWCS